MSAVDRFYREHKPSRRRASLPISRSVPADLHSYQAEYWPNRGSRAGSFTVQTVKDFLRADIPLFTNNFVLCPHKHHCLQNAVFKGFFRTLAAAYVFKTTVSLVSALATGQIRRPGTLSSIYRGNDAIQFAQTCALMSFSYKIIVCGLRRYRLTNPWWHHFVAGWVSAAAILVDDPTRRKTLVLYCMVRCLGDLVTYLNRTKEDATNAEREENERVESRNIIGVFTIAQMLIMYAFMQDPEKMDRRYYKWILHMGNLDHERVYMTARHYKVNNLPFQPCYPYYHEDKSCLRANIIDWFAGIVRAARMYLPVHLLPTFLFTPKYIVTHPTEFLKQKTFNVLRSSIFLTTYQTSMKGTNCLLRHAIQDDNAWTAIAGGFFAGLSLGIEHPKRRMELLLYVLPRAIEILLRMCPKDSLLGALLRYHLLPVFVFQCVIGVWMTLMNVKRGRSMANKLNMTVLEVIFGTKH